MKSEISSGENSALIIPRFHQNKTVLSKGGWTLTKFRKYQLTNDDDNDDLDEGDDNDNDNNSNNNNDNDTVANEDDFSDADDFVNSVNESDDDDDNADSRVTNTVILSELVHKSKMDDSARSH